MKYIISIITLYFFINQIVFAQQKNIEFYKSQIIKSCNRGEVTVSKIQHDWFPQIQSLEMPKPGSAGYHDYLLKIKEEINKRYPPKRNYFYNKTTSDTTPKPILLRNFEGNLWDFGAPNDNDMAISNGGKLVSVVNSIIYIFDVEADSLLSTVSLDAFADTLGLTSGKYDPKVVYDPKQDRFILVFLNGYDDTTSYVVVGFSETSDPTGKWSLYSLNGNPLNNGTWSDYPIIAITNDELFITVNSLWPDSSWQTGFVESIIWQINKSSGYNGDSLITRYYNNIKYENKSIRNLCPIKGGATTSGPNIYLLSNRNFDIQNDTVFILEVTGILEDITTTLKIEIQTSDKKYGVPPSAKQQGGHTFETNDARILSGFYENNKIQFVQNTLDTITGFAAVYHGVISNISSNKQITGYIIVDTLLDFGYPNISYSGKIDTDDEAIITYNHTALTVYAGLSATFYSNDNKYSEIIRIKDGETYVNVISGKSERWGDYSGSQRKYNEPGKVWASGYYGKNQKIGALTYKANCTWIAELLSADSIRIPQPQDTIYSFNFKNYPNPARNILNIELTMEKTSLIEVSIRDIYGRMVKTLIKDKVSEGKNLLTFSTSPLRTGIYFIIVSSDNETILVKKIVIS